MLLFYQNEVKLNFGYSMNIKPHTFSNYYFYYYCLDKNVSSAIVLLSKVFRVFVYVFKSSMLIFGWILLRIILVVLNKVGLYMNLLGLPLIIIEEQPVQLF